MYALKSKVIIFSFFFVLLSFSGYSQLPETPPHQGKILNPAEVILEHIRDAHEWHLWGSAEKNLSLPLPVILWDEGWHIFSASRFEHGKKVVKDAGKYYRIVHEKIYKTNASGLLLQDTSAHIANERPLDLSITKNVVATFLSVLILCGVFLSMSASYKGHLPGSFPARLLESVVLFVRDELAIPNIGAKKYRPYLPFLLTIFFFILVNNILGLLPAAPNVTGNISTTLVLAMMTFIIVNMRAKKAYWKHIFWMPGVPMPVRFLLAPIEFAGVFIKPLTLCIRLFANMTAGHIIILSFICLIFIFKNMLAAGFAMPFALFISLLEVLVAFLQAFIFTALSALFIGIALEDHEQYETH
ncbi:F0F1 ATP synthase subunit A [Bacteroidetes bacterium endosymbiont of Geopemphigus sp.]|uniref:F0F1 ATP synthase subunit A n=1 Tax=Bacteroidetes bacterium endosymbiont of Geopemphigus sp. TaxID=2047937 RepID=UPI001F4EC525|nr:F0F1 ATP synthase subunit A [Bacteroidetes bacterium endosymbiont of Geopemphigus sp.]